MVLTSFGFYTPASQVLQAREAAEERKRVREEERKRKEEKMRRSSELSLSLLYAWICMEVVSEILQTDGCKTLLRC